MTRRFQRIKMGGLPRFSRTTDLYLLAPIIILWILILSPSPRVMLIDSDMGCQVAGAQQIAFGEHPFVDWHSTYGPLTYYVSYAFRVLTGNRVGSEIAHCTAGYLFAYLLLYSLIKRHSKNKIAALLILVVALAQMPIFYKYYLVLTPLCLLLAAYRYLEQPNLRRLSWMSAAIVLAGLYRSDLGVDTLIAGITTVCVAATPNARLAVKNSMALCAGVLIFAAPWLLFLIYHGQLQTYLWESSFGVAGQVAGLALPAPTIDSSKPWLSVENRIAYSYVFWFAIPVISAVVLRLQRERLEPILRKEIVVTIVLAGLCLLQATHRSGYGHLIQSVACCYVLLGFLYQSAAARSHTSPSLTARNCVAAAVALIFLAISASAGYATISRSIEVLGKKFNTAYMYFLSPPDFVYQAAIRFPKHQVPPMIRAIQKFTTADEAILVVPYRTTFYPLSQRRFAGGQMLMAPGYFSSHEEQQNLINVLKEQGDPMVIEITGGGGFDRIEERQTRVFASLFYEHIDANYRALDDPDIPWGYTFWMHRDKVPPTL